MRCYSNLFAYLNQQETEVAVLQPRDRAMISPKTEANLERSDFLIHKGNGHYELAFPYLRISDLEHHGGKLHYTWVLELENEAIPLTIADVVLDSAVIEENNQLEEWQKQLGNQVDESVAIVLRSFTGLCETILSERVGRNSQTKVIPLLDKITQFQVADATQPLVISLKNRYKLDKNLRLIAPKLRQQLRRQAELIPVGRIQEMDAYCLRDYTRRPGRNAPEKAGSRQELMGVKRYQDYDTPENRFLIYFAGRLLYRECLEFRKRFDEIDRFEKIIRSFRQQPEVKPILRKIRRFQFTTPNYVLLQNPIYNSFYRAYLDFVAKRSEKEQIWGYRSQLLGDVVYACLTAALMKFQGLDLDPLSTLQGLMSPDRGQYLTQFEPPEIRVLLQHQVYVFQVEKQEDLALGDLRLTAEIHNLESQTLAVQRWQMPIWVFWYRPSQTTLEEASRYCEGLQEEIKTGLIVYFQDPPNSSTAQGHQEKMAERLHLLQIPDPVVTNSFIDTVEAMAQFLQGISS